MVASAPPQARDGLVWLPRERNRAADAIAGWAVAQRSSAAWQAHSSCWRAARRSGVCSLVLLSDAGYSAAKRGTGLGWVIADAHTRSELAVC
ncbi:hypothetical protein N9L68_00405 [bacterium]|nr:hypothetical protein [bacterium]